MMEDKSQRNLRSKPYLEIADESPSQSYNNNTGKEEGMLPQLFEKASSLGHRFQGFVDDLVSGDARNGMQTSISFTEGIKFPFSNITPNSQSSVKSDMVNGISSRNGIRDNEGSETGSTASSQGSSTNLSVVEATQSFWNAPILKGILSRVQTTLRGSADDIGWLLSTPGMPAVLDGTDRFNEFLGKIRNGECLLPGSLVYLLVPGLFSNHGPLYFVDTKKFFSKLGLACHIAKIHSEASVETNALELKQCIEELYWGSGKKVIVLGHSKGGVDAAAALALYWRDLKNKVAGLALVQSPYGGSPIASDILREGQIADAETRRIMELLICKFIKGDLRALEDLTYEKRRDFISKHELPADVPLVSFHTEASIAPGVLATMSHVAHAEISWLPAIFGRDPSNEDQLSTRTRVAVAVPIAAAMAICALHLQMRYGAKSDGLVVRKDAEVPGSVVVRPERKLDHAWMVYSSSRKNKDEPDPSQMCQALLALLVDIGQQKAIQH